jgi:tetratricopeptide (TPR) repeat protein
MKFLFVFFASFSLLICTNLLAQSGAPSEEAVERELRRTPALSDRVYQRLSNAQLCAEGLTNPETGEVEQEVDMDCAFRYLNEVRAMANNNRLNAYEVAQLWNFYAFIYLGQEDFPAAIEAYETLLSVEPIEDIPLGLEMTTRYNLVQLYFSVDRFEESLAMLDTWFELELNPAPEPYVLQAQLHYQTEDYESGIISIETAIEIATTSEREMRENWFRLLNVFHFELENTPGVISALNMLVNNWPKREYFVQLSAMYGQNGNEINQLALYETAYEADWLERGAERVQLAQLLLSADIPVKAAYIMQEGLNDETIESTRINWRVLAQSWQLAQEDQKAIPAMIEAAERSDDGEIDVRLAQSYQNLAMYEDCRAAAENSIEKGDLRREDQAHMIMGACLFELKEFAEAREAFQVAMEDERSERSARSWIDYVNLEEDREAQLRAALAPR